MRTRTPKFTKLPKRSVMPKARGGRAAPKLGRVSVKRGLGSAYGKRKGY